MFTSVKTKKFSKVINGKVYHFKCELKSWSGLTKKLVTKWFVKADDMPCWSMRDKSDIMRWANNHSNYKFTH